MRDSRRVVVFAAASFLLAGSVRGQDSPPTPVEPGASESDRIRALEKKLDEQQRELDELRTAKDEATKPAIEPSTTKSPDPTHFEWGFDDGFFVKGEIQDQRFELRPVGRIQLDYRAFPHASSNDAFATKAPSDEFLLRRAWLGFSGWFAVFRFDLVTDLARTASTQLPLAACFFEYRQFPKFVVRFGHFVTPFGLEDGMTLPFYMDFIERMMIEGSGLTLAPDYRVGGMVYGTFGADTFGHGVFQYYLACTDETQNNVVGSGDPMITARLASEVGGLLVGASGRWENRSGIPPATPPATAPSVTQQSFPGLTPGQFQFFAPVLVRGWTQAYEGDVSHYQGPFWIKAEFGYGSQERWRVLADHSNGTALITQGAALTAGWLFWAPAKGQERPLVPFKDWQLFSLDAEKTRTRNVGAEVVVRVEYLTIDEARGGRVGQNGVPAQPSTAPNADKVKGNDCRALGLGLNLGPTENVRFMADWYHLRIGDQSRAERAHSRFGDELLFRGQLEF
jgi:phosphate-selective porin